VKFGRVVSEISYRTRITGESGSDGGRDWDEAGCSDDTTPAAVLVLQRLQKMQQELGLEDERRRTECRIAGNTGR